MKTLSFWLMFSLLVALTIILFATSPAGADTPSPPVVKIGPASQVLVKLGPPYIALRRVKPVMPWPSQSFWPSRWDIRKPRH